MKKQKGLSFVLPKNIQNVGTKIKNLFYRHTRSNTTQISKLQKDNSPMVQGSSRTVANGFDHYKDNSYQT